MRTRQKFLSLVMAFIMILSILPSTASAEEQEGDATAACTRTEGCTLEDGHEGECVLPDEPEDEPEPEDGTDDLDTAEPEEQEELIAPAALEDTLTGSGTEEAPYVVSSQEELAAAVAQGGSIKLEDDIYLTEIITIPEGKSITLDLNGKAITVSQTSGRSLYAIDNKGTFTLTDSSSDGDGSITARGVENYGTMYMEGGTINSCDSNGGGAAVWNEGTFEMAGGALKFTGQKSGNNAGSPFANAKSTAKATITGGELESPYTCMFVNGGQVTVENISVENSTSYWMAFKAFSGAELTLKNVTVNSKDGGCVEAAGGTVNLEDCTFNQGPQTEAPGEVHTSSAVAVSNNGTVNVKSGSYTSAGFGAYVFNSGGTINIEGGTFEANTVLKADDSTNSNRSTIHVSGGDFTGELSIGNESTLIAEGGAFSATLDKKYLPDTVKTTTDADGKTVVTKLTETDEGVVAKVGSDCYKSLSAAIAAGDNDIVTLLQDTTENVTIAATQNITLDLNGKTLNGGSNQEAAHKSKAAITNNGTITIQDSSNPSTGVIKRGDVKVASAYYVIDNQGTMTIKSGTVMNDSGVRGQGASLIRNAGLATEATLNIEGGTFQQDNFLVIKNDDHGILNIAGGHFISKNDSAVQNWANANISGGTIEGIVYTSVWSNDFEAAKTEISGDVVITGRIVATQTGNGLTVAPEVKINGGNLDITSWRVQNADFIDISGGHFSKPVKPEYLNESLTHELQAASGDYPYSYYKTLEDAQKAAGPNDTVAEVVTKETGKTYYTVTLVYDDGATAKEVKTVVKDESIDLPEPNRSGYNFNGWYNGSTKVDSPYTVSADVTLTAQWAKKITPVEPKVAAYKVEHYQERLDGTYTLADTDFPLYGELGKTVTAAPKEYDGYTLDTGKSTVSGTVTIPSTGEDGQPVILTLKLYYKLNEYTVTFNSNGGTDAASQTVKHGGTVEKPADPTRSRYDFDGWFLNGEKFDFGTPIAGDITLTAQWSKESSGSSGGSSSGYTVSVESGKHGSVTVSPKSAKKGTTVTITVKPDKGCELDDLTVTDRDGDTVKLTKKSDTKYTFTMPAGKVTVEATFVKAEEETTGHSFTDVPDGYWAEDAIAWASENGCMNGSTATTFNPEGTVSRQQLWMILARLSGYNPATMAEAKSWAVDNGISDGTAPGGAVSRQQLVTILYRYAVRMGYKTSGSADLTAYPDHASVAAYAKDAMSWSVANSIVGGTTQGTLNPAGTATRAQFAVILSRFCENIVG